MNKAVPIILAILISAAVFGGVGYWLGAQKATTSSTSVTATVTTTATANTTSWKTYTNSDYSYSFKYPSNYFVKDTCYAAQTQSQQDNKQYILISKSKLDETVPDCAGGFDVDGVLLSINSGPTTALAANSSTEVVGGQSWTKTISQYDPNSQRDLNLNSTSLVVNYGNKNYSIFWSNTDPSGTHDSSIDQILSTFQFTK